MDFVPINQTTQYVSALVEIKAALITLRDSPNGLFRTPVRIPDDLVKEVEKRGTMAHISMMRSIEKALEEFCPIGEWSAGEEPVGRGKKKMKKYIQFYLLPVKT